MRKNEKGFGVIEILLIIAVIGLIIAIGWLFFSRQKDSTQDNKETNTQQTTQKTTEQQSTKDTDEGYLVVKEWGVRFKVPSSLKDTEIVYKVYDDKSVGITTARVKTILDNCKYEDTAGGSQMVSTIVTRSANQSDVMSSTDGPILLKDSQVSGHYYARSGWLPVTSCTTNQIELQKADANALADILRGIEVASN